MAVFPIREFGDPILRTPAGYVENIDDALRKLMSDMTETMLVAPGVGLAAPQIGISKRVIVWSYEEDRGALANPRIADSSGSVTDDEACLSLPGLVYPVQRAEWVRVEGLDPDGEEVSREAYGWVARIFQHEVDHTNGVLFIERLAPDLKREAKRQLMDQVMGGKNPPARKTTL